MKTQARPRYEDTPPGLHPDFHAPAHRRIPQMAIVLAVQDACSKGSEADKARRWLFDPGTNFRQLAELAGWDVDWLRRKVGELMRSGKALPRLHKMPGRTVAASGDDADDCPDKYEDDGRATKATSAPSSLSTPSSTLQ